MRLAPLVFVLAALSPPIASADEGDPFDAETMGAQLVGELLGMVAVGAPATLIGYGLDQVTDHRGDLCSGFTCYAMVGGILAGQTIGVQLMGDHLDGRGRWWGTTLGTAAGVGTLYLGYKLADTYDLDVPVAAVVFTGAVFMSAPIVGYHLSALGNDDAGTSAFMLSLAAGRF